MRRNLIILMVLFQLLALAWSWTLPHGAAAFSVMTVLFSSSLLLLYIGSEDRKSETRLVQLLKNAESLKKERKVPKINGSDKDRIAAINEQLMDIGMAIAELQRKEHAVLDHALDVICTIGPDQVFLSVNPAAEKVWGYKQDELIGKNFAELVIESDRKDSLQAIMGAEQSVDTLSFENRIRRKNGGILNVLWSAHWSAADKAMFCVAHDITERKKVEMILEESEARFREIFSRMPVGLIIANPLGIIEMSNPTIEEMTGYYPNELIGKNLKDVLINASPLEFESLFGKLNDLAVHSKKGSSKATKGPIRCQVSASALSKGGIKTYLLVIVDISERQKLEQLKQAFFAMVSHDLRSPLTSLLSMLDLLHAGKLGELSSAGSEVVAKNSRETERLINLVNELLDIEKMRAGEFDLSEDRVAISQVLESSSNAVEGLAQRRRIKLELEPCDCSIVADSALLIRVLVNLISNAIKFSPEQGIVKIAAIENKDHVLFSVADEGPGIAPEFRQRIFDLFQQVDLADSKAKGGTGLGLTICKMIVEQHGGRIWVDCPGDAENSQESKLNKSGSVFRFVIPKKQLAFEKFD